MTVLDDGWATLRDATREALLSAMREWSEEEYCAGWLIGLEMKLHRLGGKWETLGRAVGWPIGVDAEGGWEMWEEAAERYTTPAYLESIYGRNWQAIIAARALGQGADGEVTTSVALPTLDGIVRYGGPDGSTSEYRILGHLANDDETHTYYLEALNRE